MFTSMFLNVLCIFLMMVPGYLARRKGWIRGAGIKSISSILVKAIYPCLIISSITQNFTLSSLLGSFSLPASSFGIMCLGYAVGLIACFFIKFKTEGLHNAFLFQTTINNYSFFPMALVLTLFGMDGVAKLIFSSLGAEFAVWTLGVFILNGHKIEKENFKHLLSPPLVALYAAVALLGLFDLIHFDRAVLVDAAGGSWMYQIHHTLAVMGQATIPMAMIIAGGRMATITLKDVLNRHAWFIAALRLIVIPIAAVSLLKLLPLPPDVLAIMTIVAMMPVSLASMMLSELYGGDKALINGSVLLTHLLSLITVPILLNFLLTTP